MSSPFPVISSEVERSGSARLLPEGRKKSHEISPCALLSRDDNGNGLKLRDLKTQKKREPPYLCLETLGSPCNQISHVHAKRRRHQ